MGSNLGLSRARWRKSSYSGDQGGSCVECATLHGATWRKSSHSGDQGGECIQIADLPHAVAVRDSKNPDGPAITFTPAAFDTFVRAVTA
ncbi:DUF397 domain-containing protein [Streptomyces crystallinus]|uniref:DUF397 domain-containing protein n=1 Tax=Streptomyces crystallinus TaxID=68191 RepID=A0ABP3R5Q1_9ACTN